jgi:hypothetical protein
MSVWFQNKKLIFNIKSVIFYNAVNIPAAIVIPQVFNLCFYYFPASISLIYFSFSELLVLKLIIG